MVRASDFYTRWVGDEGDGPFLWTLLGGGG